MKYFTLIATVTLAHTSMSFPPTRSHPKNPEASKPDFLQIMSPLGPSKPFPCGYPAEKNFSTTFNAGQVIDVKFFNQNFDPEPKPGDETRDQARHSGGQCEFSLSYDHKKFMVIATYNKSCPDIFFDWPVKIPDDAPESDHAIFAWTWINATGNREFYMNCADVKIKGKKGGELTGKEVTVANLPGFPTMTPDGDGNVPTNAKGSGPSDEDIKANLGGSFPGDKSTKQPQTQTVAKTTLVQTKNVQTEQPPPEENDAKGPPANETNNGKEQNSAKKIKKWNYSKQPGEKENNGTEQPTSDYGSSKISADKNENSETKRPESDYCASNKSAEPAAPCSDIIEKPSQRYIPDNEPKRRKCNE